MANKKLIITIAVVATVVTLGAIIFWYAWRLKNERVICDIAHQPSECELLCREIYRNATNITEGMRQNVLTCMKNCPR